MMVLLSSRRLLTCKYPNLIQVRSEIYTAFNNIYTVLAEFRKPT